MSAPKVKETIAVEKGEYERLVADAKRWRQLRARVLDYQSHLPSEKRGEPMGPYERWARDNMKNTK